MRKLLPKPLREPPAAGADVPRKSFALQPPPIYICHVDVVNLSDAAPFITKDGSEIRELLAYRNSSIRQQSLAEARIQPGGSTQEHFHPRAEEIYYITRGTGRFRLENEVRDVKQGDAIAIPPGLKHKIWNTGSEPLQLLCCCAPAYENDDTVLTESA
jgi:mannose-6-phosphate isomerase-like protein (cupin superfamily)